MKEEGGELLLRLCVHDLVSVLCHAGVYDTAGSGLGVMPARRRQAELQAKLEDEDLGEEQRQQIMKELDEEKAKERHGREKKSKDSADGGECAVLWTCRGPDGER